MGRKHPTGSWNNTGGAIPEEYQRVPAPVFVVNSDRRSEDVDDEGKQKRRAPGSSDLEAHQWRCWDGDGAGAKLRTEVRAIKFLGVHAPEPVRVDGRRGPQHRQHDGSRSIERHPDHPAALLVRGRHIATLRKQG